VAEYIWNKIHILLWRVQFFRCFRRKCMQSCSPNQNKHSCGIEQRRRPAIKRDELVTVADAWQLTRLLFSIIPGASVSAFFVFSLCGTNICPVIRSHFPIEICSAIKQKNRLCGTSRVETFANKHRFASTCVLKTMRLILMHRVQRLALVFRRISAFDSVVHWFCHVKDHRLGVRPAR
jgi:hypothetical protein